jgi:ferritin-like metal-binding protein YciE
MPVDSLQDLYQQKLQMILDAEQQGLQAYPQMLEMVQHQELRQAMQTHMQQTQQQVEQLQRPQQGGQSTQGGQRCVSMQALI